MATTTGWVIAGNLTYGQLHTGSVIAGNIQLTHRGNRGISFAAVTGRTTGYPGLPGCSDFCDFSVFFKGYSLQKSAKTSETQLFGRFDYRE
jgi:lipoprotein signal peptidase